MIGDALLVPRHSKAGRAASSNQNWGTAYVYDGFGNLLQKNVTAGSAPSLVQSVNTATNQIDYVNYDANGNQTTLNGTPAAYDAQNRMIQYNGWNHYAYNASNQRVWRLWAQCCTSSGQQTTSEEFYVYGVNGQRVGTYTLTFAVNQNTAYASASVDDYSVYFAGRLIGHGEPYYYPNGPNAYGIQAVSTDQVGSVIDDKSLVVLGGDTYQQYYPWGEEKFGSSPNDRVKFATYRRDSESLLDYAWNRYYDNTTGRFLTPDPYKGSADPYNPQSWNRYAYGLNDPVKLNDPTGRDDAACGDDSDCADGGGDSGPGGVGGSGGSDGSGGGNGSVGSGVASYTSSDITGTDPQGNPVVGDPNSAGGVTVTGSGSGGSANSASGSVAGNSGSWLSTLTLSPWAVGWIFPLGPLPAAVGVGPAGSIAWNPATKTLCSSIGAGASVGNNFAGGPVNGTTLGGQQATPSQIDQVFGGWSANFGFNLPTGSLPVGVGVQVSVNGSGTIYGPTVGVAGLSVSSTYAICVTF